MNCARFLWFTFKWPEKRYNCLYEWLKSRHDYETFTFENTNDKIIEWVDGIVWG